MRGKINSIILYTLKSENLYGLQIIKAIDALTNGQIGVKLPSLYSSLHKLEAEEYITSYWENSEIGGKRRYSALTEKGRQYVEEHPIDFSIYNASSIQNSSNAPSSLAIQPDFFNTIAHSEKIKENQMNEAPFENEIPNYSILDYISTEKIDEVNLALNSSRSLSNKEYKTQSEDSSIEMSMNMSTNFSNVNSKEFQQVYDKNDAVLLSDDEIIPQNESTSLLYRPTTLSNDAIKNNDIDYAGIFGDMIEKDVAKSTLFGSQNDAIGNFYNTNDVKHNDENIEMTEIGFEKRKDILSNCNALNTEKKQMQNSTEFATHNCDFETIQIQSYDQPITSKKNISEYLMKDKIVVDEKYKANIFLKKSNFTNSEYDFFSSPPKYNKDTFEEIKQHTTKIDKFFNNNLNSNANTDTFDLQTKTLDEFILDCKKNGIDVVTYNNSKSKIKINNVYINRINLVASIITFSVLTALLVMLFFIFKSADTFTPLLATILTILTISSIYPVTCAILLLKNSKISYPYLREKKEWGPRTIIVLSIIFLTFAVNIFNGMNPNNIDNYLPYVIIPTVSSLMIIFDYIIRLLFLKAKIFRFKNV